eukprot:s2262_g2.t1
MVEALTGDQTHKSLGRRMCGSLTQCHVVEFNHQVQLEWNKLHRHRRVLIDKHVSIQLRMKFFDAVVTPMMLLGLHTWALTDMHLCKESIQRWMLRSMVDGSDDDLATAPTTVRSGASPTTGASESAYDEYEEPFESGEETAEGDPTAGSLAMLLLTTLSNVEQRMVRKGIVWTWMFHGSFRVG